MKNTKANLIALAIVAFIAIICLSMSSCASSISPHCPTYSLTQPIQAMETKKVGFAAMTPERRSELGRMGGLKISQDKNHMAEISRKGHTARLQKKKE